VILPWDHLEYLLLHLTYNWELGAIDFHPDAQMLIDIRKAPCLKNLSINFPFDFNTNPRLESISLANISHQIVELESAVLPLLKELTIDMLDSNNTTILPNLNRLLALRWLELENFGAIPFDNVSNLVNLESFHASHCKKFNISVLNRFSKLQKLVLWRSKSKHSLTLEEAAVIGAAKNLAEFDYMGKPSLI
jgi:hypothetical protein